MKKLLQIAMESATQAEVYFYHHNQDLINIQDENITKVKSSISSGYALRVINNGKIGIANTCNLLDRENLVKSALKSVLVAFCMENRCFLLKMSCLQAELLIFG